MTLRRPLRSLASALLIAGLAACGEADAVGSGDAGGDTSTGDTSTGGDEPSSEGGRDRFAPTYENVPGTYQMAGSDQYVLDADGTFRREEGGETLSSGTWALDGDRIVLSFPNGDSSEGIAAGETRVADRDGNGLILQPDSERPRSYPQR